MGLFNEILVTPGSTFFTVLVTGLIIFLAFVRFLITGIGNAARLLSILSLWLTASLASTPALANPIAGCNANSYTYRFTYFWSSISNYLSQI